jgi:hypothetical protein
MPTFPCNDSHTLELSTNGNQTKNSQHRREGGGALHTDWSKHRAAELNTQGTKFSLGTGYPKESTRLQRKLDQAENLTSRKIGLSGRDFGLR